MSIETLLQNVIEALEANTAAVKQLEGTLVGRAAMAPKEDKPTKADKAQEKVKADPIQEIAEKAVEQVSQYASEALSVIATDENGDAVTEDSLPVPYETVRKLVLALAPTKRDQIKAINAAHGINNLKVLLDKEDDYSTVNDQAKLEAVYADLLALEA